MQNRVKHLGVRLEPETHAKLAYIAKYEGRTLNGQVYYLAHQCIRQFEEKNGPITEEDMTSMHP